MNFKEIIKKVKRRGFINSAVFIIVTIFYKIFRSIFINFFKHSKIEENYIIFYSFPDFSDNAKELYDYYRKNYSNYKYIWLLSENANIKKYNEKDTIFIKAESKYHNGKTLKALYYIYKSKVLYFTHKSVVDNSINDKKEGQLIINLWHGCGYKNTENKDNSKSQILFDYVLVPGKVFIETKSKFWNCDKQKILDIGYPRYDSFFRENKNTEYFANTLKNTSNKLIIWMPTFRKTGKDYYPEENLESKFDLPLLNSVEELKKLNTLCEDNNITLCIKRHPLQIKYECENIKLSNIIFISNDDLVKNNVDLYSLLRYTNGLITDYSSIAIDYLLMDKPIAFSLSDFDKYMKARGFVFENPLDYMPGHHLYDFDNFSKYIYDVSQNNDIHKEDREKIMEDVHNKCENYCERIVNKVKELEE